MADTIVITNVGLAMYQDRLKAQATYTAEPKHIAWGVGTTTAAATDTALDSESAEDRTEGTSSLQTTTTAGDTYQVVGTITSLSVQAIVEVGLLDSSASGNLFLHGSFDVINVNTSDSIAFTIKSVADQAA